ncbi:hypothetical protein BDV96DRAFT_4304 [Lophiotrema nucula]|uniref:Uncharacterized protein n=1 Tax=Lophiotrema nucula TaxID=690887 RepID=A0A6A5ZT59_9PLEO|nr:hypothetical protein BDV96DRAFT_4304 [Lophiotrema nucula]
MQGVFLWAQRTHTATVSAWTLLTRANFEAGIIGQTWQPPIGYLPADLTMRLAMGDIGIGAHTSVQATMLGFFGVSKRIQVSEEVFDANPSFLQDFTQAGWMSSTSFSNFWEARGLEFEQCFDGTDLLITHILWECHFDSSGHMRQRPCYMRIPVTKHPRLPPDARARVVGGQYSAAVHGHRRGIRHCIRSDYKTGFTGKYVWSRFDGS